MQAQLRDRQERAVLLADIDTARADFLPPVDRWRAMAGRASVEGNRDCGLPEVLRGRVPAVRLSLVLVFVCAACRTTRAPLTLRSSAMDECRLAWWAPTSDLACLRLDTAGASNVIHAYADKLTARPPPH